MPIPTGTVTAGDINTELGLSSTAQISLNDAAVREMANIPSGQISFDDLRGRFRVFISDSPKVTSSVLAGSVSNHTATVSSGTPSAYAWGVESDNNSLGEIVTGGSTATAQLRITIDSTTPGSTGFTIFYCDVTIGSETVRQTMIKQHTDTDGTAGGGGE